MEPPAFQMFMFIKDASYVTYEFHNLSDVSNYSNICQKSAIKTEISMI